MTVQGDHTDTLRGNELKEEGFASHLPPRREYHQSKKKRQRRSRKRKKMKYPIIKILVAIFLLLPIIIATIIFYLQEISQDSPTIPDQKEPVFDHVEFEDEK
ncbi:hypothetical protein [Fervidibacillus halotolerans]|uniref:Uncharacterized protein n=1 Tax=Fervidibacillus halotolerans TaxID=2980027 RepID=A0A9E8M2E7_9BACI|nr:hypothetical protein [Fervidibacillus halotolerans]WAA13790.1 hypothetical protein OE105_06735 [Fervidibacillus halotolerans]